MDLAKHLTLQKVGLLRQAAWATVNDATSNYKTLNYDKGVSILQPFSVKNQQNYAIGSDTLFETEDKLVTESAIGLSRMPFKCKMSKALLAPHLAAAFQSVSEAAAPPYKKVFIPADNPELSFNGDSGYIFTIVNDTLGVPAPGNGDAELLHRAILDRLTIKCDNMGEGLAHFFDLEGEWVGNQAELPVSLSGTWVAKPADTFFNTAASRFKADLTVGGVGKISDICWHSFEMTLNNQVYSACVTDKVNEYYLKTVIDVVLRIKYTSAVFNILSEYKTGSNFALDFYNVDTTADADGEIAFQFPKAYLTDQPKIVDGDYFGLELKARIIKPTAGWSAMVTMTDAIDWAF